MYEGYSVPARLQPRACHHILPAYATFKTRFRSDSASTERSLHHPWAPRISSSAKSSTKAPTLVMDLTPILMAINARSAPTLPKARTKNAPSSVAKNNMKDTRPCDQEQVYRRSTFEVLTLITVYIQLSILTRSESFTECTGSVMGWSWQRMKIVGFFLFSFSLRITG